MSNSQFEQNKNELDVNQHETTSSSNESHSKTVSTSNISTPSGKNSSRSFSSYARLNKMHNFMKCNSVYSTVPFKYYHTSSPVFTLTSEDLAKLAKLKHSRKKVQENISRVVQAPTLNPKSKEKKVPSTRIGRIGSFGGMFLWFTALLFSSKFNFYMFSVTGLAAGLALGTLSDFAKKSVGFDQGRMNSKL